TRPRRRGCLDRIRLLVGLTRAVSRAQGDALAVGTSTQRDSLQPWSRQYRGGGGPRDRTASCSGGKAPLADAAAGRSRRVTHPCPLASSSPCQAAWILRLLLLCCRKPATTSSDCPCSSTTSARARHTRSAAAARSTTCTTPAVWRQSSEFLTTC